MRPSSSPSDGLLGRLFTSAPVDAAATDTALLQALLDVERALAEAGADAGLVPPAAAEAIAAACDAARYDVATLGQAADGAGNPVVPLVRELTAAVAPQARPWVHHGATSQDILDTALFLVVDRALGPMLHDLDAALAAAARLAERYRDTIMVGRTLGQQASPTTFGLKAAGWLIGLLTASDRLRSARGQLAVQLGGAVGTLAALHPVGPAVAQRMAERLGLACPPLPWHTDRQRVLDLAAALGGVGAAVGKVALDIGLLAQTEVGEVVEGGPGRGQSSAMPHKRNPVDSVLAVAVARRTPGLVATLFGTALQEHERAAGAWHAEWEPLLELLRLAGASAQRCRRLLDGLEVRPDRMRANLDATRGLVMAESVSTRLSLAIGRTAAHDVVAEACAAVAEDGTPLRDALLGIAAVREHLAAADIDAALDPYAWLGEAGTLIDRALAAIRSTPEDRGR